MRSEVTKERLMGILHADKEEMNEVTREACIAEFSALRASISKRRGCCDGDQKRALFFRSERHLSCKPCKKFHHRQVRGRSRG